MGCGTSKTTLTVNELVEGQNQAAIDILLSFGLDHKHINMLYAAFCRISKTGSGTIKIVDLLSYFHLNNETFERHVFSIFDGDRLGVLNFLEFGATIWNLLTLTDRNLGMMAYMMKDPSGAMKIRFSEIQSILETIHLKKLEAVPVIQNIFANMKANHPSEISMQEFCKCTETHITIIQPLLIMQLKMRKSLVNEQYWNHMSMLRQGDAKELGSFGFIRKLQLNIRLKNEAFRKKRHEEETVKQQLKSSKSQKFNIEATTTEAAPPITVAAVANAESAKGEVLTLTDSPNMSSKEKKKKSKSFGVNDQSIKNSAVVALGNLQQEGNGGSGTNLGSTPISSPEKRKPISKSSKKLTKSVKIAE